MFTIHEAILNLIRVLEDTTLDAQKFDEGNFVAGRRLRKSLAGIARECKAIRASIISIQQQRKE